MNEIDCLLRITSEGVSVKLGDSDAMLARLEEWLYTPRGSIYGLPAWGNPLQKYKHENLNNFTAVAMENDLVVSLKRDIPELPMLSIRVEALDKDLYQLTIGFPWGDYGAGLQKS